MIVTNIIIIPMNDLTENAILLLDLKIRRLPTFTETSFEDQLLIFQELVI